MEFDARTCALLDKDGLVILTGANKVDDYDSVSSLMAKTTEARTEILGYQMSLESLEVILKTHEKNEYAWGDKYEQMEYDLKIKDLKLEEKQKELDQFLNKQIYLSDKTCIGFGVESSSGMESDNSSGNTNSTDSLYPNFQKTKGFHSVPPPTDWVDSDDEETVLNSSDIQKKTVLNSENSETSFENKSPSSQNSVGQGSRKTGLGHKGVDALGSMTETGQAVGFVNEFLCDITFFYVEGDDVVISSHSEGFSPASCHGSLDESLMEDVNILEDDGLLAMHEIIHWVYNITKAEYVACAKLLCLLSPKSTSWEQFGTNIASALVGLATNRKFNFSLMIMNGMLGHISNGTPFLMYPRITPCHPPMLEVVTTLAAEEAHNYQAQDQTQEIVKNGTAVSKHHTLWVESQKHKKRRKKQKKQKKKVSSVKLGRNKDEGTLSEEHYVQDDYTADPFFEDIVDKDAAVTPDLERKSDETEEINIEEKKASDVKSGDTEELDLEAVQSTARQSTITPRTLNFDDEAGPSSPIRPTQNIEPEEQFKVDEVLTNISRPRGLSIPGPIQSQPQPQQPSQATDPKDKGKGILDAEEERKRLEELKKAKPKTTLKKSTSLAQERNHMMNFLKGLILLGDLPPIWETAEISDDDFWKNQEDWEIVRWRFKESSGVHTLELEDGTMIHMLAERRYPLSRELMIRMLDHGMEVEDESEIAIAVIHLFILWTTKDCGGDEDFF
ncbi:hypothetical protein Tco_0259787 [Tanacetum coccineum]